jgi:hypothetical protein
MSSQCEEDASMLGHSHPRYYQVVKVMTRRVSGFRNVKMEIQPCGPSPLLLTCASVSK